MCPKSYEPSPLYIFSCSKGLIPRSPARVSSVAFGEMKAMMTFLIAVVTSAIFAVVAKAFGYGVTFAAKTLAMQIPLLAVMLLFSRTVARLGRKTGFVFVSIILSLLFVASGIEDVSLCIRFGVMHESDAGLALVGDAVISLMVLVVVAVMWAFSFRRMPNQVPEPTSGLAPGRGSG